MKSTKEPSETPAGAEQRKRPYRMATRAATTAATHERILDAAQRLFATQAYDDVSLERVAAEAGVGIQTVIRHGCTKEQIFAEVGERSFAWAPEARERAIGPTPRATVANLVDHFEQRGDTILHLLAQRARVPAIGAAAAANRTAYQEWVARAFASVLDGATAETRRRRLAQLVAVTDVHAWHALRREAGLSREETELALYELLAGIGALP